MANLKISDLTAAASAVGTHEYEVNESGTSKKVTGTQLSTFIRGSITLADVSDVTATAAELNKMDGVTATTAELNKLDGVAGDVVGTTDTQTLTNKTLTTPVINAGSDATGDIYYRTAGGVFERLAIGTTDQVLTVASGLPSWADASGGGGSTDYGAVGTYVFGYVDGPVLTEGATIAGSSIEPAGTVNTTGGRSDDSTWSALGTKGGSALSGTWRIMGRVGAYSGTNDVRMTLFVRIS